MTNYTFTKNGTPCSTGSLNILPTDPTPKPMYQYRIARDAVRTVSEICVNHAGKEFWSITEQNGVMVLATTSTDVVMMMKLSIPEQYSEWRDAFRFC